MLSRQKDISKDELEQFVGVYFNITAATIEELASYDPKNQIYYWYKRKSDEAGVQSAPIPEVVNVKENEDGTITLQIEVV